MRVDQSVKEAFRSDGAILAEGLLTELMLKKCKDCFDWSVTHPSDNAAKIYEGTADEHYNDISNPDGLEIYKSLLEEAPFVDFLTELWESEHIWFLSEEIFIKKNGRAGRSPWHQDTAYFPYTGMHLANCWLSFEYLPKANSLEIVRGSHLGAQYDGSSYNDPSNPTKPMWDVPELPRLPDIEADRTVDPTSWDVLSWPSEPGDVVICHSGTLHGGAPVDSLCPTRNTLVLRFFGDDTTYRALPSVKPDYFHDIRDDLTATSNQPKETGLRDGDPFRDPGLLQLR